MKVFISLDMEGISGVVDLTHINPGNVNYERARRLMTEDVNAVIEAAIGAGAKEILVADSHSTKNNALLEELHPQAELICGNPREFSMMQGLDDSFDAVLFVGYHARSSVSGVLSHTVSEVIKNMYINGRVVGEFGFNAIYAGMMGVPVCFVSGDDRIAAEASGLIPGIRTAVVKYAVSWTAARCLPLARGRARLKQEAANALANLQQIAPLRVQTPIELGIEFMHAGQAEIAAIMPGARCDGRSTTVTFNACDQYEMYRAMRAMMTLAGTVPLL